MTQGESLDGVLESAEYDVGELACECEGRVKVLHGEVVLAWFDGVDMEVGESAICADRMKFFLLFEIRKVNSEKFSERELNINIRREWPSMMLEQDSCHRRRRSDIPRHSR